MQIPNWGSSTQQMSHSARDHINLCFFRLKENVHLVNKAMNVLIKYIDTFNKRQSKVIQGARMFGKSNNTI